MTATTEGAAERFIEGAGSCDPAEGMPDVFAARRAESPGVRIDLRAAAPEPVDVRMERRRRATHPDASTAPTRAVAGRPPGNPPGGFSDLDGGPA